MGSGMGGRSNLGETVSQSWGMALLKPTGPAEVEGGADVPSGSKEGPRGPQPGGHSWALHPHPALC